MDASVDTLEARGGSAIRLAAAEHARTVAEQADRHALTLESVLAVLRSSRVTDAAARAEAVEIASAALVDLRTVTDQQRSTLLEPVTGAFSRLRADLRPLVRFGDLDVQFVEPPATGRALPGDVAHAARAIVRTAVLALVDDGAAKRVRIQWDCDGRNLLMQLRDDGSGTLDVQDDAMRPIAERVVTLDGRVQVASTPGWGSVLDISLPLDPRPTEVDAVDDGDLTPRERDVLRLVATGVGNREIAEGLGISVNTVKYHVANLLRKHGARTRAELAAFSSRA
ncbi:MULTISPECIES: helix-turn-helix transcriptional regulator [Curtobacterium]|jgi:DNA-binding CsgD family transcriptional regulator/signal transduction histidine kinase|uniref:Winged helix-turn-helix transcriptional regulator n=2 Tax=Curtobacterium TaxID=2034 RepID=A0A9Q2ZPA9_9MICO|nr:MULTISPECIES: LuxR C-terminal-related transcriptional regulator [Curtobacterium]EYT66184.1 LuxR family transcriptional regulator [Curtobacterium flaccumfaciens UCD-AKU]MBO9042859.1 winged helix-turn-helix transcriptional regulator [Curtobacterium flaccumfaciens pv. flaccumfaciens]MBT1541913.1 winged helix-turn-helix transcriptional regulator [Curtobacterium flaccumfaciens pv. flaccumfaciens]MBT1595786.1 winged helix-turn-helix transcriptional regulator [Curtobacterium flaccumfaciens pv. flac